MVPIEIDGLPFLNMVIFHGKLLVITRWYVPNHQPDKDSSFSPDPT